MAIIENFNISQPTSGSLLSSKDTTLIETYTLTSKFNTESDRMEAHLYSLTDELLTSDYNYRRYKVAPNRYSFNIEVDTVEVDPIEDLKFYGYSKGDIKINYVFIRPVGTSNHKEPTFFIKNISPDRTELLISSTGLNDSEIKDVGETLKELVTDTTLVHSVVMNLTENVLLNIINVQSLDSGLAVKLYEPLPNNLEVKNIFTLGELVGDSVGFEVTREEIETPDAPPALKGPNFNIDLTNEVSNPTEYLTSLQLLQALTSSLYEPYSVSNKLGTEVSIDYTDYSNFIHFSSLEERVKNFKYKLDTIAGYQESRSLAESTSPLSEASASMERYDSIIAGIVNNFDHYDRHLYFESGSTSWPKSNTSKPYLNYASSHPTASVFYSSIISSASLYDETNTNRLINSIPSFLKEDENNAPYNLFVDMVGQHFDNLWLYSKAVGDRYDADNRLDRGISKEIVGEALRGFGVKLYSNNASFDNLFSMFVGEFYQTGSETVNTFVTGSTNPTSKSDYQREIYKRLYHNIPLLLKSKGTERGIKALFTSFGIPTDLLSIKYTGGTRNDSTLYYGPGNLYTSSLDRITVDRSGSIVPGSTLSENTTIVKKDSDYNHPLHTVQVGYSPTDYIDQYIISEGLMPGNFDIDNYIGDSNTVYSGSYQLMNKVVSDNIAATFSQYDLKDLIRLVKFYDNSFFKMLKDFVPARTNLTTGIIVKPSIFYRSKAKQVKPTTTRHYYTGSASTGTISGNHGRAFKNYNTAFSYLVPLPSGSFSLKQSLNEAKFTGELSGSQITVATGELNSQNIYKKPTTELFQFHIRPFSGSSATSIPDSVFGLTISVTGYTQ